MEGEEGEKEEEEGEEEKANTNPIVEAEEEDEGGEISFHALKGGTEGNIIKVKGQAGRRRLPVLIDSGSTHSFLNKATTTDLKCELTATTPLSSQ